MNSQPSAARCAAARCVQRVDARILQLDERGKFPFPGGLGQIAVRLGSERIQREHAQLHAGHVGLDRRQHGVDRDLRLRGQFAVPESVEIRRAGRREADLRGSNRGAHRVESVVAAGVAAD